MCTVKHVTDSDKYTKWSPGFAIAFLLLLSVSLLFWFSNQPTEAASCVYFLAIAQVNLLHSSTVLPAQHQKADKLSD